MNKLLFSEGGQPLHLDDLNFMQEATQQIIQGLYASVGNCILWGARIDVSGFVSCEPGAILYEGKVYEIRERKEIQHRHDERTIYSLDDLYWDLREHRQEPKTFEDGQVRPTRLRYSAELLASKTPMEGKVAVKATPALYDRASFQRPLAKVRLTSNYLKLLDYEILSRFSALLTLQVTSSMDFDKVLGSLEVEPSAYLENPYLLDPRAIKITGETRVPRSSTIYKEPIYLEVENGKLYYRRDKEEIVREPNSYKEGMITILVSWGIGDDTEIEDMR